MAKISSKEKIVKAARRLILSKGYPATSVDEIIAAAGVSKGSLYYNFATKEDLAIAALQDFLDESGRLLLNGAFRSVEDPAARAFAFLEHVEEVAETLWVNGCMLVLFSMDTSGTSERVREETRRSLVGLLDVAADLLAPLTRKSGGRIDLEPSALAHLFMAVIDGSIVYSRATGEVTEIVNNLRAFRLQLRAAYGEPEQA